VVTLVTVKDFVEIINYCFVSRIILKNLKEFIIVVLCKERKKNYFFLNSYKLITFKNILIKILKKHVINIMFKATKEYKLFL